MLINVIRFFMYRTSYVPVSPTTIFPPPMDDAPTLRYGVSIQQ